MSQDTSSILPVIIRIVQKTPQYQSTMKHRGVLSEDAHSFKAHTNRFYHPSSNRMQFPVKGGMAVVKRISVLSFIVFLSSFGSVKSQTRRYDIVAVSRIVGTLQVFASRSHCDTSIFAVESTFSFLFHQGKCSIVTRYVNQKLISASSINWINEELSEQAIGRLVADQTYEVRYAGEKRKGKDPSRISKTITKSIISLYFEEPALVNEVYSERYGKMCAVRRKSDHVYAVMMPDGKEGLYAYKNGICEQVSVNLGGLAVKFVLNH